MSSDLFGENLADEEIPVVVAVDSETKNKNQKACCAKENNSKECSEG